MGATRAATIVGIGASAGALEPLERLLAGVPPDCGMAFVVVQQLDRHPPSLLTELLGKRTRLPVTQAEHGALVEPDRVYVIPPDALSKLEQGALRLSRPPDAPRAAVDTLFASLAEDVGEGAVGIILSGTGTDGMVGLRAIREHGGLTLAQSRETASWQSMPRSAVDAGLVDFVSRVEDMSARLVEHQRGRAARTPGEAPRLDAQFAEARERICEVLHERTGHDFRRYKEGTLLRRIRRRAQLRRVLTAAEYLRCLETEPGEAVLLLKDLLIGVTQFFRDPEPFQVLAERVLPALLDGKPANAGLRIWIPGCSSGEEAYSLAILARELLAARGDGRGVQIFATDIDVEMLARARRGRYPDDIAEQVSPERLLAFFVREEGGYLVSPELRDMCVFTEHNLIRDPPFSSIDLVSCRNVLIYLEAELQQRLIPLFHYALRPRGCLFLGPSEGIVAHVDLFRTLDKKSHLFQRNDAAIRPAMEFPLSRRSAARAAAAPATDAGALSPHPTISQRFERMLLEEYAPPAAVVNEGGGILSWAGRTGRYLQPPVGAPTNNLLELAQGQLRLELRAALASAVKTRRKVVRDGVPVEVDGRDVRLRVTVRPLPGAHHDAGLYAVILQETGAPPDLEADAEGAAPEDLPLLDHLEDELRTTRAELQAVVEELEATNEELKSSNEELTSTNEELSSSNEELQTSQEEIQSINDELLRKVEQLAIANGDLQNLFASTHVATLFLDRGLRVTKFTPAATTLFHLLPGDVGRPLADLAPRFQGQDLIADALTILDGLDSVERHVRTPDERSWYVVRVLPYRTSDHEVAGVVVTFVDITKLKQAEADLRAAEQRARTILESISDAFYSVDADWRCTYVNRRAGDLWGMNPDELLGRRLWDVFPGAEHTESYARMHRAMEQRVPLQYETYSARLDQWLTISLYPGGRGLSVYFRDISERKRGEDALRLSEERHRLLADTMLQGVVHQDASGRIIAMNAAAERILGKTREELLGSTSVSVEHDTVREDGTPFPGVEHPAMIALQTGQPQRSLLMGVWNPRDAAHRWILIDAVPLFQPGRAEPYEVYTVFADITERRQAEEALRVSEQRYAAIFERSPFAMALSRMPAATVVSVNEAFVKLLGFTHDEVIGKTGLNLGIADAASRAQVAAALERRGSVRDFQATRFTKSGERRLLSLNLDRVIIGGEQFVLTTLQDVTDQREAEEALREADRRKSEFLAMLSHELRNPLTPLRNSTHVLQHVEPHSDLARRAVAVIDRQGALLSRVVDDLLDVTRITHGKIELHVGELELDALVERAVEDQRSLFDEAEVRLELRRSPRPLRVTADASRLAQVIGNLLQNAAKFTPPGGAARVTVDADAEGRAVVRVADTGMGMAPELLARLFEPFSQAENTLDRTQGGLGLGLALAKRLVELHGGDIAAHSEGLGRGSELVVRLPVAASEADAAPRPGPSGAPGRRRVLVIEDNLDAAHSLRDVLELDDHLVEVAHDGREGLAAARAFRPDLVLCDIGLPGMDGYEVARAFRADEDLAGIRVVALTGYALVEDVTRAREAGFDDHLAKPPSLERLAQILAETAAKA